MKSNDTPHQPACLFAHDLINKLAVIVGFCDLLSDKLGQDAKSVKQLNMIRDIAASTAKDLGTRGCSLTQTARTGEAPKNLFV
ncbi:MAG: hypothetical protein LAP86_25155 [Acidobacteriia bacterium]|nr:hypothetical protein [Terriglobia bacterium]